MTREESTAARRYALDHRRRIATGEEEMHAMGWCRVCDQLIAMEPGPEIVIATPRPPSRMHFTVDEFRQQYLRSNPKGT